MNWTTEQTERLMYFMHIVLKRKVLMGMIVVNKGWWENIIAVAFTLFSFMAPISSGAQILSGSEVAAWFAFMIGAMTTGLTIILKKNRMAQARIAASSQLIAYHLAYNRMDAELLRPVHDEEAHQYLERCSQQLAELYANDPPIDEDIQAKYAAKLRESGIEADDDFAQLQRLVSPARLIQCQRDRQNAQLEVIAAQKPHPNAAAIPVPMQLLGAQRARLLRVTEPRVVNLHATDSHNTNIHLTRAAE